MIEEWRSIDGYEGLYEVSNKGIVKSLDRFTNNGRFIRGKILNNRIAKNGYLRVNLYKFGRSKSETVHRLVANSFIINNDHEKNQVNHKDEDKNNNYVDNLEWVTAKENNNYGTHQTRAHRSKMKRVKIITDDYVEYIFDGVILAAKYLKIDKRELSRAAINSTSIKGALYVGYLK